MATQLKDIFSKNQYELKAAAKESKTWFLQQARLLKVQQITPNKVMRSDPTQNVSTIRPGNLYLFMYEPKGKADLPYYDMFPMVFPFKKTPDGFIGLNMHYIPYMQRTILLQRLMDYATNKEMNDTTRLKYSWKLIDGISRFKWAEPCIKQYLRGHVRSSLRFIAPEDWATAMLLPVEQFVGASKDKVWADSLRYGI
jgi:hypothetical protein